jgi:hypothetical protein
LSPLGTAATNRTIVPAPGDYDNGEFGGMIGRGNQNTRRKTYPSATFSTTNSTWLDPVLNPGRRDGKPATNRLSYGAATGLFLSPHANTFSYTRRQVAELPSAGRTDMAAYEGISISIVETNGSGPPPAGARIHSVTISISPLSARVHRIRYRSPIREEYGFLSCNCVCLGESSTFSEEHIASIFRDSFF